MAFSARDGEGGSGASRYGTFGYHMTAVGGARAANIARDVCDGVGRCGSGRERTVFEWDAEHVIAVTQGLRRIDFFIKSHG